MSSEVDYSDCLTVGKLLEIFRGLPEDMLVVLSSDAEGNSYSPGAGALPAVYEAESPWSGDVIDLDDAFLSHTADSPVSRVPCVVLYPFG